MNGAAGGPKEVVRSLLGDRKFWIWVGVWVATRALIVANVGFWDDGRPPDYLQDVNAYGVWSDQIATTGAIPDEETWQYPPGAAYLMLLPRLLPGSFGEAFVGLMVLVDLIGFVLIAILAGRSGRTTGVWVWLIGLPLLGTFSVLRFDLVPTVIGIAALVVIHIRPAWFGVLAGLGASIKVWPIVVLFGEWDRRRLLISVLAATMTISFILLVSAVAFGDLSTFVDEQGGRGLQEESVGTIPWGLREVITGQEAHRTLRFGAWEIPTHSADVLADVLKWLSLAALGAAAIWWWLRERAIRGGRTDLEDAAISRDFIFTIVLLMVVTSRVLSPQFMIWLLGLAAVVFVAGSTRLARPAWVVIAAVVLSTSTFEAAEETLYRNIALLVATIDASVAMVSVLLRGDPAAAAAVAQSPRPPTPFSSQPR